MIYRDLDSGGGKLESAKSSILKILIPTVLIADDEFIITYSGNRWSLL